MTWRRMTAACAAIIGLGLFGSLAVAEEGSAGSQGATTEPAPQVGSPTAVGVRVGDEIFYEGGNVVATIGPAAFDDCPASWLCLWEHASYAGRMVRFQDSGYWQSLVPYGFNDVTSSWRNRRAVDARLGENAGGGTNICVGNGSSASYIGDAWNDRVSSVYITYSSTIC